MNATHHTIHATTLRDFAEAEANLDVICTECARTVAIAFDGQLLGFWNADNPTATIAANDYDGHDFAIIATRFLVDAWATCVESIPDAKTVYDLHDTDDATLVTRLYGPRNRWTPNPLLSSTATTP